MIALARLPVPQGVATMQSINIVVINPVFLGVFMGTAVFGMVLAVMALANLSAPMASCMLAGSLLYLAGCLGVTMAFNVPLNNQLAEIAPEEPTSVQVWTKYLAGWVRWNHLRTLAALLSCRRFHPGPPAGRQRLLDIFSSPGGNISVTPQSYRSDILFNPASREPHACCTPPRRPAARS